MTRTSLNRLLMAVLGTLVLAAWTSSATADPGSSEPAPVAPPASSTVTTQTTTSPPVAPTSDTPTDTETTTTTTAAPETDGEAPQVQTQSSQAPSTTNAPAPRRRPRRHVKPSAAGGSSPEPPAGHRRAPASPFALTPPLPSSLGSPISGIPDFFIASFRVPPFLLPIYQAAGSAYGIPWQVLAAINEVETDYGRDLSVSSAGAEGWMQFLPSSWAQYGVDANGDGFKDPYNPADAIFATARYLKAAGGERAIHAAVFAYNHSQTYVSSVMLRAQLLGGSPPDLLGAIAGLTEARFPVHAASHFSDGFASSPAHDSRPATTLVGTTIYTQDGAPAIAVQDGVVVAIGDSPALGRHISLRDAYGNTYTYAQLGSIASLYPELKPHDHSAASSRIADSGTSSDPAPSAPASAGVQPRSPVTEGAVSSGLALGAAAGLETSPPPAAPSSPPPAPSPPPLPPSPEVPRVFRSGPNDVYLRPLHVGVQVIAGTVLGHVGEDIAPAAQAVESAASPHMLFQIRPTGAGAPLIDPKPILDGWVRLESTSIFRAKGENPFLATSPTVGQVLLESKEQLQEQVLHDRGIDIYPCGRQDIESGQVDRRVLATLEFLSVSGLKPTVSALKCGHSEYTTSGNVSEHSTGDAVDIAAINGTAIAGHQGPGSIADTTIRKLLTLQGTMKAHQIISLMSYPGTDNTLSMPDHYNHIHVGFRPTFDGAARIASTLRGSLSPDQWIKLISRLGEIPDPNVSGGHSAAAIPDRSDANPTTGKASGGNH